MWRRGQVRSTLPPEAERPPPAGSRRDRLAILLAIVTVICLGSAFYLAKGTQFLMPGPLASAHGAIEKCSACHTKSGSAKLSWVHGLVAGDPLADSKACLTCHRMPDTAFNAHGASAAVLEQSTKRLTKIAERSIAPQSARAQSIAFPTHDMVARGLYCATCHQEHQGVSFNLNTVSNEQCRSCHAVKFDSFDGNHPKFDSYPFKRRSRIRFDHAGHFGKHYPEVAQKYPARRIPATCSTCHSSSNDRRVMAVAPFDKTCTACHLDQIVGKERATGPKGIAFLSLPGLDLETLKKKKAAIGEWPEESEAALTPFMKVMIGRDDRGRALLEAVHGLNLQDLTRASDGQIKAVTNLVWEIKGLFYTLISGKASDVLADLNIASGAKLSASLVADLTASIPRDVLVGAQQEWLPNLATEMINAPSMRNRKQSSLGEVITRSSLTVTAATMNVTRMDEPKLLDNVFRSRVAPRANPSGMKMLAESGGDAPLERLPLPSGTPRSIKARSKEAEKGEKEAPFTGDAQPQAGNPGANDAEKTPAPEEAAGKGDGASTKANGAIETPSASKQPQDDATNQADDLLFPTEEELRAIKAGVKGTAKAAEPVGAAGKGNSADARRDSGADSTSKAGQDKPAGDPANAESTGDKPRSGAPPVITIESSVDPESWAEYGGWYRQDYTIFYRPTGHKDKFLYSWLFLTGPQAQKGSASPVGEVFDFLTSKDAQGSCTKCHSVDDIRGKGRLVNFSPQSVESKRGRFTNFIHEPHFGIMEQRGCLTCHKLEKASPYLKSYEQGNPQSFVSNFGAVQKDLCQTCHTSTMARQDCLLCHQYHVNGVVTPIISTKIPAK
jgi:hypothetical protein